MEPCLEQNILDYDAYLSIMNSVSVAKMAVKPKIGKYGFIFR
jgi:hypothetical protein